ncbi:hypothetical protein NXS19_002066 [Fusarium pseudograminearum]|nr:hypothetical protein NXS19_002066 [Fusarium pseudograminearum]
MTKPMQRLNTTPNPTKICHLLLQIPSWRNNHVKLPKGKKKPTIMAFIKTSITDAMPAFSSSRGLDPDGRPSALLSIQASSILRNESGDGIASGVKPAVCIELNCVLSVAISEGVIPDCSNRSKPLGRGLVDFVGLESSPFTS